jgi:pentafunctional AROM polypeptide
MTTIYLYNRTRQTAENVVFSFPSSYNIVLIGTLPAKATYIEGDVPMEGQVLIPKDVLSREGGCVVIDMAYLPRSVPSLLPCLSPTDLGSFDSETPLLRLATSLGHPTSTGLDVLLQQGFEQFRLWNGMEPPTELCRERVVEEYERENPL